MWISNLIFQGETGANALHGPCGLPEAVKNFEKKFKDKTKNAWADRDDFKPVKGKYTLIEMANDGEDDVDAAVSDKTLEANLNICYIYIGLEFCI